MRFIILLSLIFSYLTLPSFASRTVVTRQPYHYSNIHSPYYNNYYMQENRFRNGYYPHTGNYFNNTDFNGLERYVFNRNYYGDSNLARLERLEQQAFGVTQSGDFNTRYKNVKSAILSRPKQNYQKSLIRNIGDYLTGQMTGYTPSLNSFDSDYINSDFVKKSDIRYSSPYGNRYGIHNYSSGSSAGIRILD